MKQARSAQVGLLIFGIILLAICWKIFLLLLDVFPFNSDEAVVGLMARHILQGDLPIFFYGQAYMGSLDAILLSLGFSLFGSQVWVIRAVQVLLYAGVIFTTILMGRRIPYRVGEGTEKTNGGVNSGWKSGIIASILLAIPTVNVTLYTTVSLGGYGEALLLGNLIVLTGLRWLEISPGRSAAIWMFAWAVLVGLGLWANGLTLIYSLPMGVMILWRLIKDGRRIGWKLAAASLLAGLLGVLLGALPWLIYAAQNGLDHLLRELSGSAVAVEQGSWISRTIAHAQNLILLGGTVIFGLRPPWEVRWLALPLLPLVMVFWSAVIVVWIKGLWKKGPAQSLYRVWMGTVLTLFAGFIFTSFGVDPSGRYFIPLAVPLALAASEAVQIVASRVRWQALILGVVVAFNSWGTLDSASRYPPGITTQFDLRTVVDQRLMPQLVDFLVENGETRGYANYWIAYPLAFNSDERVIFTPRLPYHQDFRYTERDDRYPPYKEIVLMSDRVAYITSNTPKLDELLRNEFSRLGVSWLETKIGDFQVFYRLSEVVRPEDIGLGKTTGP